MNLSIVLKSHMKLNDIAFRKLAEEIGCNYSTLWRFVDGNPSDDRTLVKVLTWLLSEPEVKITSSDK